MDYSPSQPFQYTSGPQRARIAICGEAWGKSEAIAQQPFVGASGQELTRMLSEASIDRRDCLITNVFPFQPLGNDLETICTKKAEVGPDYPMPPLKQGKYIRREFLGELERLRQELYQCGPNLVIALGNPAIWALMGATGISTRRGVVAPSSLVPGLKVLPTYHPAAVLRSWDLRVIAVADFMKARREAEFSEIRRPEREVLISPTLDEIAQWCDRPHTVLGVDTETRKGTIRSVQFARSPSEALVIPFWVGWGSYWQTVDDELIAWSWVKRMLESDVPKIFQNGLYDLGYLVRMGIRPRGDIHDTMLRHHALYPEMQKGLGFLGSLYSNEQSWKIMHRHNETKADE